jgi:hypothetical protein
MVFIGGPRQVGKTTLALACIGPTADERHPAYLNWDNLEMRERILRLEIPSNQDLVILDEIHKFADWRSLVKGLYDTGKSRQKFLITGSARLDHYRRGGDSLQGRYHYHRLHPFSLGELGFPRDRIALDTLLRLGGFPEPLARGEERFWRRWQRERRQRVVYEDIRDLENVREVSRIDLLLNHLPNCVGSPLSINSLRELLGVAHETVERWVSILENLYFCFRIAPYGHPRIRAVKKENKLYFWDWSSLPDGGSRFENLVACQLLKYCHHLEDTEGYTMELRFLRDTDGREIDFVVVKDSTPMFAVECKSGDRSLSPAIRYYRERTPIPAFYQVHLAEKDHGDPATSGRVLPFTTFCRELELP